MIVLESEATPQATLYVVVCAGDTDILPDVAPPVEKLVPVQEEAWVEDQLRVADCPRAIVAGLTESDAVGWYTVSVCVPEQLAEPPKPETEPAYVVVCAGEMEVEPEELTYPTLEI